MSSDWKKVEFQDFINSFGMELVVDKAPKILYTKKDKEHEAYGSLVAFFFATGGLLIYISISILLMDVWFNLAGFLIVIGIIAIADVALILNYVKSSVFIKPLECWVEIYEQENGEQDKHYCFSYYPIYSGKCHPNKAKDIIYKLYQEEILKGKIDITQIELYLKRDDKAGKFEELVFFFQYGEGKPFTIEDLDRNAWKFFDADKQGDQNFISVANWDHQYEWRDDLQLDFDKLHDYAPWIIRTWNKSTIKPLTEDFKEKINWKKRCIDSMPKLEPWKGNLEEQQYSNDEAYKDIKIINKAIDIILGENPKLSKIGDVKEFIPEFKSYFRDLN